MVKFPKWDDFLAENEKNKQKPDIRGKVDRDVPPQGKNSKSYYGPNAKNDGKVRLRVAEKPDKEPLGKSSTPSLSNPEMNIPGGKRTDFKGVLEQRLSKDEPDGKVRVRVAEKDKEGLGDEATPSMKDRKSVVTNGEKPSKKALTTEQFLKETRDLSNEDFLKMMLSETYWNDDEEDDEDQDGPPSCHCAFTGKRMVPIASEVARYMARMIPENGRALRAFLRELKSTPGGLSTLINEVLTHNEAYNEMVNLMGEGDVGVCGKMVKAMQDSHEKFMEEMGYSLGEAVKPPMDDRMGFDKEDDPEKDSDLDDEGSNSLDDELGDDDDLDLNVPDDEKDSEDDKEDKEDSVMQDIPPDGMGSVSQIPKKGKALGNDSPMAKLNKEFAYHHMIKEMSKYNNMVEVMENILKG